MSAKKPKAHSPGLIAGLALIPAVILLALYAWHWSTSAATGTIITDTTQAPPATKAETQELKTAYFSVMLPADLRLQHNTTGTKVQVLAYSSTQVAKIGFTANIMPAGGIQEVGDYHMRSTLTGTYQIYKPSYLPDAASAFQKNGDTTTGATLDDLEITIFLPHSTAYASITASGSSAKRAQIEATLQQVIRSWQWR